MLLVSEVASFRESIYSAVNVNSFASLCYIETGTKDMQVSLLQVQSWRCKGPVESYTPWHSSSVFRYLSRVSWRDSTSFVGLWSRGTDLVVVRGVESC
jgi:hypothetical protein